MVKKHVLSSKRIQNFWQDKSVVVTGGAGFLGRHVVKLLEFLSPKKIFVPRSAQYDLRKSDACLEAFNKSDLVIHLAGVVGGIGFNQRYPVEMLEDNLLMGIHVMQAARKLNIPKTVIIGTICAYPKFTPVPFKEEHLWNGYPEETNAPYGLAKRILLVHSQVARAQYGFNSIYLLPVNLYGPEDKFDLENSHVIPALIRKFLEAKQSGDKFVELWGTGKATREFLFVEDAAEAIILASALYNKSEPVNIGSGEEISIKQLAKMIKKEVGFKGKIIWNKARPDGQPRRLLDVSKALQEFGFSAKTSFEDGIKQTIEWYKNTQDKNR